ncbi:MAG: hypothetical protein ACW98Y_05915 [Candidatus Thorarchaeota archaeon]|jgi:hypothetical protein
MSEGYYYQIGKALACIGAMLFLIPVVAFIIGITNPEGPFLPPPSIIPSLTVFIILGLTMIYSGVKILRRFRKMQPFVTKGGEPIHMAEVWKKGTELGLYLTSCGKVVSINQSSEGTAHVGYRLVTTKDTICSACSIKQGRAILDSVSMHGEG